MRLNVLTAVSRPENLAIITDHLAAAALNAPGVKVAWRWAFDIERQNIGGQNVKNRLIEQVLWGEWVWVLDDDTLAHPDILREAFKHRESGAIVFSQLRSDGRILEAHPENVCVGGIDIGQAFLRRSLIGDNRIPDDYNGDGLFLQVVLPPHTVFVDKPLSLHNAISGVEVGV